MIRLAPGARSIKWFYLIGPLGDKFARLWEDEVARAGSGKRKPSLLRVIMRAYAARCMLYGFVLLVMECGIR